MIQKKRSFLLVELILAFSLMAVIITTLLSTYQEFVLLKKDLCYEQEVILDRKRLLLKLKNLFSQALCCTPSVEGLYLKYENSADPDPSFRGGLNAFLYVENQKLFLVSWKKEEEYRTEVLYYHPELQTFSYLFFDEISGKFASTFPDQMPSMIKISLHHTQNILDIPLFL